MPTYEYRCKQCHYRFEKFQQITEKKVRKCPNCGGPVERLISAGAGIIFKGSGFYSTDYRSKSYKDGLSQEKEKSKAGEKSKEKDKSNK